MYVVYYCGKVILRVGGVFSLSPILTTLILYIPFSLPPYYSLTGLRKTLQLSSSLIILIYLGLVLFRTYKGA